MNGRGSKSSPAVVRWGTAAAATVAILIGAFWLGAWFTGYAARHSLAGLITMKTNMALGQLLAGMALLLLGTGRRDSVSRWVGMLFAAIVSLIGALTLAEHLFGWNLGIDQLLAKEPPGSVATVSPNRIGPPGSLSLALLGMGLLALASRRQAIVPFLGISVCVINLVPAVGFVYGIGAFYHLPLTGIAWPTTIALSALGLGLVMSHTGVGPMELLLRDDAGGKLFRGMLPWVVLVPLVLGYFRVQGELRGFYGTAAGSGVLAIVMMLVLSAMLWRSAGKLSRSDAAHREDEEALKESERRLSLAQEIAHVGTFDLDVRTGENVWTPQMEAMHGLPPGGFANTQPAWEDLVHPEDRAETLRLVDQSYETGEPTDGEWRVVWPDGSVHWVTGRWQVFRDESGEPVQMTGVNIDVTDHKQAEEALRELEAHKRDFYRKTILAATSGKLDIVEPEEIQALYGDLIQTWRFSTPEEYSLALTQSFRSAENLGFAGDALHDFMSCAGEMLGNAQKHAGGGEASLYRTGNGILFAVSDKGRGIDSLNMPDIAFVRGYSTAGTGGLGYKLIIASADKTYLATGPGGTTVAVEMGLPDQSPVDSGA